MHNFDYCDANLLTYSRIIVGVKYCFRYNARNRAIARGENPDEVALDAMPPGRPHRRRREKKLMTMDEVNERFPLTKYKNWTAARAQEGLPSAGGVTAPPSRAASLRNAIGALPSSPVDTKHSIDRPDTAVSRGSIEIVASNPQDSRRSTDSEKRPHVAESENKNPLPTLTEVQTTGTFDENFGKHTNRSSTAEDSDDDDAQIHDALPVDVLEHPGDSCAICIDTLDADDEVRGLTCGHAFHAGCLDPWLTSRRACCPLCKADYYVPKPRPEGEAGAEGESTGRRRRGVQPPPPSHWSDIRGGRFLPRPIRSPWLPNDAASTQRNAQRSERSRRVAEARANAVANAQQSTGGSTPEVTEQSQQSGYRRFLPSFRLPSRRQAANAQTSSTQDPTPQQLEAGSPAVR